MKRKIRGVTAVELIVTLAVGALLMVMVFNMGTGTFSKASFTNAFNSFVADFYLARQIAARENKYVAVDFDVITNSYSILQQTSLAYGENDAMPFSSVKRVLPLDGKEFFSDSTVTDFVFAPDGTVYVYPLTFDSEPQQLTLTFYTKLNTGEVGHTKSIRVYPSGGLKIEN